MVWLSNLVRAANIAQSSGLRMLSTSRGRWADKPDSQTDRQADCGTVGQSDGDWQHPLAASWAQLHFQHFSQKADEAKTELRLVDRFVRYAASMRHARRFCCCRSCCLLLFLSQLYLCFTINSAPYNFHLAWRKLPQRQQQQQQQRRDSCGNN